ncbi:unnamed protein product [Mytilus coruscus]|uniref:Transposase domain-containing protein n=1 Tax=Mytilus coruscus TaxID=42192 RepID=A0A6J8EPF3_MYTCO|nr:unnamed protein product [Mytilus coruscus]
MSDKKRKRNEYKRIWIANARQKARISAESHFSSSDEECEFLSASTCSNMSNLEANKCALQNLHSVDLPSTSQPMTTMTTEGNLSPSDEGGHELESDNSSSGLPDIDWDSVEKFETLSVDTDTDFNPDEDDTLLEELAVWTNTFQVNHNAVDALLKILKEHGHQNLPGTCRTLLKTVREVETTNISGMDYYNFGLEIELLKTFGQYPKMVTDNVESVDISLNIDGLPLFKSTNTALWPILCEIHLQPRRVFPHVLTIGPSKPTNLDFLQEAIDELDSLLQNGFKFNGKEVRVKLRCVVCDAPAKAMMKGIKLFSGYYGCDRCNQTGFWCGRITYQDIENMQLRTDVSFRNQDQEEHHHRRSPFCQLNIDMINQFPIDYMHQACLGVMKRLLLLWMRGKGSRRIRMSAQNIQDISSKLVQLAEFIPKQFARKPRSLYEIDRWKATEFRQFLLYTGKIVLKGILRPDLYAHFMSLSVAICILVSPRLVNEHVSYARNLLNFFVNEGRNLYGQEFLVYNVHSMLHISDDAEKYGGLDNCGAFEFENYLQRLKKMVRSGKKPLTQIVKRIKESQTYLVSMDAQRKQNEIKVSSQQSDNAYLIGQNRFCQLLTETNNRDEDGNALMLCRVYSRNQAYFHTPCDSRMIGVYSFDKRYSTVEHVQSKKLEKQVILINKENESNIVVLAILHDF